VDDEAVEMGLERPGLSRPGNLAKVSTINADAIKGGPQCLWELAQWMQGGEVRMVFLGIRLIVFNQLDKFVEAMAHGAWETLGNQAKGA